ncbi:exopolysaccharide Pel transporter PelG [Sphingomonas sanguinis]|uniref:exopolysaccharide Pel transporter PelG n=1 Tax=Sphingomonas sp. LC-1 TaxID=3110957 RepID=UPI0021BB2C8A|nr:exopolysaccharide Pel transporter PelG [Sphingomonas sp. LC-1]MCT8002915.1 exopolysaccharide Pel transporter PelG [Sphingomonas sp. LC-1]
MAGIGFQLAKMAREGGVGGIAGAALHGALISSGPWLITAIAMILLHHWAPGAIGAGEAAMVRTVLIYGFSLSALIAGPIAILATRLAADRLFARDAGGVPGILLVAMVAGGGLALVMGAVVFGGLAGLPFVRAGLASLLLGWLTQIWIASPMLTALRRYRAVPVAYLIGIAVAAVALMLLRHPGGTLVLAAVTGGVGVTLGAILVILHRYFTASPVLPSRDLIGWRLALIVAAAGLAGAVAIWIDKWLLWSGPGSIAALGRLRLNPINDAGSFLGLLTMVPGLTLLLIVSETRFDRGFDNVMARCTGTSTLARIEEARGELIETLFDGLRLLVLMQALVAALAWVLAVPLFELIGADPRGIFAFRHSAAGAVFHLVAIGATIVLSYYDLFARIVLIWASFAVASALAVWLQWDAGSAAFGWGYMAGAVVAASVGIALVADATIRLVYLLFVGNNPAVVGREGRWA